MVVRILAYLFHKQHYCVHDFPPRLWVFLLYFLTYFLNTAIKTKRTTGTQEIHFFLLPQSLKDVTDTPLNEV